MILNFLYVCQSVSWLTPFLKLCQYRDISSSGIYIFLTFLRHSLDISGLIPYYSEFLVILSVCLFAHFLTEIESIWRYLQFWMRYISEIFWRHSWDILGLFPNYSEFFVYLSVCQFTYFLTKIRLLQVFQQKSTQSGMRWDIGLNYLVFHS